MKEDVRMINGFEFGNSFINFIKSSIPDAKEASGGKELVCHCRYCQDSKDHGHMYIKVPQEKNDPILFHCFKCQTSGIVDSRTLIDWGIYDPVMGLEVDKINKDASKNLRSSGYNRKWYKFNNHVYDTDLALAKLEYINNRLGTNLSLDECLRNKIIFNLQDVLTFNNIKNYTRSNNIVEQLNYNFLGFLSLDNNFVNLRRLCDEGLVYDTIDKRYINYNIHGKQDNTEKMYILPTTIDLTDPRRVNIHIAEGPFDILSIRYNLRKNEDGIFAAITGSGYKGLVIHLINTFKIFYFNLHVYPDNDQFGGRKMIEELVDIIRPYGSILYEHRNTLEGEKDFGVPSDRINEVIYEHR